MHTFYTGIIVPASVALPLGAGIYSYPKLEKPHKIVFFYLIFAGVVNVAASYMAHHRINNLWLLHIYTAVETVLLLWLYKAALDNERIKKIIPYLMVIFPLVCAANIIWGQGLLRYNTYTRPVEALILIYMGLSYFFQESQSGGALAGKGSGPRKGLSWINAGFLLYFSASFFIFIFSNYLHPGQSFSIFIVISHATFVLIMYLLFMIGFLRCRN